MRQSSVPQWPSQTGSSLWWKSPCLGPLAAVVRPGKASTIFNGRVQDKAGLSSEQDARLAQALETFDSAWLIRKQLDDYLGAAEDHNKALGYAVEATLPSVKPVSRS